MPFMNNIYLLPNFLSNRPRLLAQADSLRGANISACAALCAHIGVDRILFAFRDSARRTLVNTCTASDAVVTNYVSHNDYKK